MTRSTDFRPGRADVLLVVQDRQLAEDVTQEAMLRTARHRRTVSRYEGPDACVRRVAIRIARRQLQG